MKDLTGVPDEEKHKHLNWHVHKLPASDIQSIGTVAVQRATLFHRPADDLSEVAISKHAIIDTLNTLSQIAHDAAVSLAAAADGVLMKAISARLGRDDWQVAEMKGRLEVHYPQNKPGIDVYHLDGRLLVEFHPVKSEHSGTRIRMHRQYKIYD